jgi:mono/diheme cytochrome c family protein
MRLAAPAVALLGAASCSWNSANSANDLGQGWSQADRDYWYEQTQGSRLIPYKWAQALEVAGGGATFFTAANLARYGYLSPESTSLSKLPVGFAIDKQDDRGLTITGLRWERDQANNAPWVGMNCAACHTAELQVNGRPVRVDGGPTLGDFETMIEDLDTALVATYDDPARFARFASAVIGDKARNPDDARMLKDALKRLIEWEAIVARMNHGGADAAPGPRYGNGRLDAIGHIYVKAALFSGTQNSANVSDAPVSYPFIWNTSQSDVVQWNGMVTNQPIKPIPGGQPFDYGALGRNAGEVTGVFGDVKIRPRPGLGGFVSSVQVQRLAELERVLARLRPPAWPAAAGKVDIGAGSKVALGRAVFDREGCGDCHTHLDPGDVTTKFKAKVSLFQPGVPGNTPPGTDPWMACNAYLYQMATSKLQGTPRGLVSGTPLGPVEPTAAVLETIVKGQLANRKGDVIAAGVKAIFNAAPAPRPEPPTAGFVDPADERAGRLAKCMNEPSRLLGYKARPLTGIWATAPYLHNGSVPTLYDLLLPPAQRPARFYVGTRRFDPVKVGYATEKAADNGFAFETRDSEGQPVPGNDNAGHDYGNARLSEGDRWALVEYLKTL